ncbi:extracellular calcium-sensing receptor-like [Ranitomeya variabilis]|uniref:extracellular calcium-sensing receptor-like n=1 Tax=Ranitomeya variabilis TaxID=490064 RepID=UPI0040565194
MGTMKVKDRVTLVDECTMKTLYTVIWILLLPDLIVVLHSSDLTCHLHVPELQGITEPGNIMLGVVLPLHLDTVYQKLSFTERPRKTLCSTFHLENYQQLQSMIFAVKEINENSNILANVTLGFQAYDSCDVLHQDLQGALQILTGSNKVLPNYRCLQNVPLSAIIGPSISTHSILVAHILGLYKYPQISHFSTSPLLSDRIMFPSFFRTVSNDVFQSRGLARLVLHFGWTWKLIKQFTTWQPNFGPAVLPQVFPKITPPFPEDLLLYYMKKARVTLSDGRNFYFDENGDPPAVYDIVNWQLNPEGVMQHIKIGSYDTTASLGKVFTVNTSAIVWSVGTEAPPVSICSESCPRGFRKAPVRGQPICCFQCILCPQGEISNQTDSVDCIQCPWNQWPNIQKDQCLLKPLEYLSYEETLGVTLASTNSASVLIPVLILQLYIKFKMTPIVKANNYYLSCLLLVSLSLCFLCSLLFIGFPKFETCLLRQAVFGLAFTLCISCVLAKTIMVVLAFMATKPGSNLRRWTNPKISYIIILLCTFLQFILCISWLFKSPPFPQNNAHANPSVIIVECNEGSPITFWMMLGYLFLLATISFVVAFLARRLPDSFNEAQFITFSMLAFLSVWISYVPASLSAQGKYTVAMEIFAILSSSWALVICMFFPKCYIILLKPKMNSREFLLKKNTKHG